jgi:DNA-binding IclR family transcriptional regulator
MTDPDFSEALRAFIRGYIPNVDAAELLFMFARAQGKPLDLAAALEKLRPTVISPAAARRQLEAFAERGLLARVGDDSYEYQPASAELDELVRALTRVYNERPVTLVRTIYALRDETIRSFADAFRIKK